MTSPSVIIWIRPCICLYDYGMEDRVAVSTTVLVSYNEQGPRVSWTLSQSPLSGFKRLFKRPLLTPPEPPVQLFWPAGAF